MTRGVKKEALDNIALVVKPTYIYPFIRKRYGGESVHIVYNSSSYLCNNRIKGAATAGGIIYIIHTAISLLLWGMPVCVCVFFPLHR